MTPKASVRFQSKDKTQFFATLKQRVDQYFRDHNISPQANASMVLKSITLLMLYLAPFVLLLWWQPPFWVGLLLWVLMGVGLAGVGMCIMHDANHGAYSENKAINYLMGLSLNLLGGSMFNWKLQHNVLHHTYTNIVEMDDDINGHGFLRLTRHHELKPMHRLQWAYAFFFYGISSLWWVTLKDFLQFRRYTGNGVNPVKDKAQNAWILTRIVLSKLAYFFVILGVPVLFFGFGIFEVLAGFLLMHFVAGLILTFAFQMAHVVEHAHTPLPNDLGVIENEWAIHQLQTTVDFSRHNKLISWYLGGLNFQVEHHLFPSICHVHYPAIAPIVKQTAEEFGIPYLENRSFGQALRSHMNLLRTLGRTPSVNELVA